ncbi:hypothetical protein ACSHWO_26925 [Streptomyces sp. HUAS TT3]|uniref:hypothetical protein n=1 Tax=Streptomyces sp. HUAS TT3 TaxID=3447510 RepID=UPI003F657CBA
MGLVRAVDFLEHVPQKIPLINELYRLLAPGGMLLSLTPSSDGRGAYQDPTHVAYSNERSDVPLRPHPAATRPAARPPRRRGPARRAVPNRTRSGARCRSPGR